MLCSANFTVRCIMDDVKWYYPSQLWHVKAKSTVSQKKGADVCSCIDLQVLWAESAPAPHGWTARAAAVRAKLKEAVGTLLGQLYNRNCGRQFAPPQAFQAEDLPPARFHSEVKVAAASVGGLMEAKHTRVWSILTWAFSTSCHIQLCFV